VPDLIETSYPGDAFVDVVGFDFYDSGWRFAGRPDGTWADPSDVWSDCLPDPYSLDWLSQFAIGHGKAVGFPAARGWRSNRGSRTTASSTSIL